MIEVCGVSKSFGGHCVLDGVSLTVPDRSIAVVLGRLGIGKSVLLRVMAGIVAPDSGTVRYDGVVVQYGALGDNPGLRGRLGYVFQGGALFDSMSVRENVALPVHEARLFGRREAEQRAMAALTRVGMVDAAGLLPRQLSGGMTRLVAIARALVTDPSYLFFDEPTTGLDPAMRSRIARLVRSLRDDESRTCVVVTHDLDAAHELADGLYMLKDARLAPAERVRKEDYESPGA